MDAVHFPSVRTHTRARARVLIHAGSDVDRNIAKTGSLPVSRMHPDLRPIVTQIVTTYNA